MIEELAFVAFIALAIVCYEVFGPVLGLITWFSVYALFRLVCWLALRVVGARPR
jgi:hypothetical protein